MKQAAISPAHPAPCRSMLAAEQRRLREQYEARLTELEVERQGAEADLAQVLLQRADDCKPAKAICLLVISGRAPGRRG